MIAIISLLVIVILSLLVVRIATVALTLTGLSQELARFQARSAFTGAGFTTSESERVMKHPVRRRIILLLLLLGNAGFITAISSLILSFVKSGDATGFAETLWFRITLLVAGLTVLWAIAHSEWVDKHLSRIIAWALKRWTHLEVRDYAALLHLSGDYTVAEMEVQEGDWLVERDLKELKLTDEGVLVLGVEKADGDYLGAPRGHYRLSPGDNVLFYGPRDVLADLDERRAGSLGNWDHHKAVEKQMKVESEENRRLKEAEEQA